MRSCDAAVEGALALDDGSVIFAATGWAFRNLQALRDREMVTGLAQEVLHRPRHGARAADLGTCLYFAGIELLSSGQRDQAEMLWHELVELAEHTQDRTLRIQALLSPALVAFVDGRLEESVTLYESAAATALQLGVGIFAHREMVAAPLLYLGHGTDAVLEELRELYERIPGRFGQSRAALVLALLGCHAQARAIRERFGDIGSEHDETSMGILSNLLEAAILGSDRDTLRALVPRFAPFGRALRISRIQSFEPHLSVGRLLGTATALLGQYQDARAFYTQALEACAKVRFRPEAAIVHVHLADLLLEHYPAERAEALEHLDFSIAEFRDMKMRPSLERALRRKLQLQGIESVSPNTSIHTVSLAVAAEPADLRPHAAPDGTVTLLFTDIEDSTGLTVRLGDRSWLEILRAHHAMIRQQVHDHGGFEVKCQGDGFMLAFGSARRGLDCAVAIQRAVEAGNSFHPESPIRVRIGLHTGEALKEADDFHGKHVVVAARIADQARGGEILVSALLKELTESSGGFHFDEGRGVALKGLAGPHQVFELRWR
jgi:eukaryotic-like serine/threonine-protein kinase